MEKKRVFGTGGELLVHQLVAQGVSYAFTNTGSAEAGFFNALLTVPGVPAQILLLAESLVLSAADGYAKAARKPAFVNVHLAAGTRQGSAPLQNAYFDGTPMVVTAAMRDVGSYGDHGALVASGGFSQMGAVDITKRRWEVWEAGGIPTVTRRAFKDAMTFPTGPVYVAYASSALEATNVEAVIQAADAPHMGLVPDASVLRAIWDALLNAENPLLVCGPDIVAAGAQDEIMALAERPTLPVATGIFDYSSFPLEHPHYVGGVRRCPRRPTTSSAASATGRTRAATRRTCDSRPRARSSGSATTRRSSATASRSTSRCGATCATRCAR